MKTNQVNQELNNVQKFMNENFVKSPVSSYYLVQEFPNAKTYFVEVQNGLQFYLQIEDIGASHLEEID